MLISFYFGVIFAVSSSKDVGAVFVSSTRRWLSIDVCVCVNLFVAFDDSQSPPRAI